MVSDIAVKSNAAARLLDRIGERQVKVGVIGLGYVGLPLAIAAAEAGYKVLGVDIDNSKAEALNHGSSYIGAVSSDVLRRMRQNGNFEATSQFHRLAEVEVVVICVPTPLSPNREPDLSYVSSTVEAVAAHCGSGTLVVLESTSYPGTTRDIVLPLLVNAGLRPREDVFVAFSPEREDPGNRLFSTTNIPKVVGADGADALRLADTFYRSIVGKTVVVSSPEVAEAVKITENVFRAVNIALVNELKIIYDAMGIDIWEVIEAASTKPFGYMPFYPGPGLGGHCIPIDPFYLTWKAREYDAPTRFVELAGEINTAMPDYVARKLAIEMDLRFAKGLNGARILLIGMAYKKNIADIRESPSLRLARLLTSRKAKVEYHDPFVPLVGATREYPELTGMSSIELVPHVMTQFDAAIIATDHDAIDYSAIAKHIPLILDTRNAYSKRGLRANNVAKA